MRQHLTVSVQVGRAAPQAFATLYTCPKTTLEQCEKRADALEAAKLAELVQAGNAPDRITFAREVRDVPDAPAAQRPAAQGVDINALTVAVADQVAARFASSLAAAQAQIAAQNHAQFEALAAKLQPAKPAPKSSKKRSK